MGYIEKSDGPECFNPTSGTVKINCDCNNNPSVKPIDPSEDPNTIDNKNRWAWLVDGWADMSFKSRMKLFLPRIEYIKTSEFEYGDPTDEYINEYLVDSAYINCRTFRGVQFTVNDQGTPCIMIIFNPIDINSIPDESTRSSVESWARKFHFT